jgi:hypothetical protein
MTKTLNQIIFFSPPKSEYFFQQHWESEWFFLEKNHNLPFKLNGRSLMSVIDFFLLTTGTSALKEYGSARTKPALDFLADDFEDRPRMMLFMVLQ